MPLRRRPPRADHTRSRGRFCLALCANLTLQAVIVATAARRLGGPVLNPANLVTFSRGLPPRSQLLALVVSQKSAGILRLWTPNF